MQHDQQIIHIHALAPTKPAFGAPCNGCGVCCLVAPCPLGMVLSRKRSGTCHALRWGDGPALYRCGAVSDMHATLEKALPRSLRRLAPLLAPFLRRLALRWIAAGKGCDSTLEPVQPDSQTMPSNLNTPQHD